MKKNTTARKKNINFMLYKFEIVIYIYIVSNMYKYFQKGIYIST